MPNAQNVASPINIHGSGRSGTTLLQNILGATGYIQVCNETNNFVLACYRGGQALNPSHDKLAHGGPETLAVRGVHAALCAVMPSVKVAWCQKLGGLPNSIAYHPVITEHDRRFADGPYPFPYAWFWRALSLAFPQSSDILILRDYRDIIISRSRFSGFRPSDVAADLAVYFNVLAHPASRIDHVILYDELAATPDTVLPKLFGKLGIAWSTNFLNAMKWHAAPSRDRSLVEAKEAGYSWRDQHDFVLDPAIHATVAPALLRLADRLGLDPARLGGEAPTKSDARTRKPASEALQRLGVTRLSGER